MSRLQPPSGVSPSRTRRATALAQRVTLHKNGQTVDFRNNGRSHEKKLVTHRRGERITKNAPLGSWARNQMGNIK